MSQTPALPPAAADSLRRALDRVFAGPEYQWVEQHGLLSWIGRQWQRLLSWFDALSQNHPLAYNILLAAMVVALLAILVHVGYVMWRIMRPAARGATGAAPGAGLVMDARAHIARAEELARLGRYAEALAHRFLAALLELDRRQVLHFHLSKTPAEYVAEANLDARGREKLASLVAQLYRHLFGAVPCDETEYRSFGEAAHELARGSNVVPA